MDSFNAHPASSEIQYFLDSVEQGKNIADISNLIQQEVQRQIEQQLMQFQESIAQSNLTAIEVMYTELAQMRQDTATLKGVFEKLKLAVAPEIPVNENQEVVSFRQAINNLERYGSIIPSVDQIANTVLHEQRNHAWSLFRQAMVKMLVVKLEKLFSGNCSVS